MAVKHLYMRDSGQLIVGFVCTEKGDRIPDHVHPHGHFFFCAAGGFQMDEHVPAYSGKWVAENTPHGAVATEPNSIGFCFQYLRDIEGAPFGKLADQMPIGEILAAETRLTH